MTDKKISDEKLIEERAKGKTLTKIAEEYGYEKGSENSLQERLKNLGMNINLNRKTWTKVIDFTDTVKAVTIPKYLQKKIGINPDKDYKVNRVPMPDKKQVLLRFKEDEVGD